MSAATIERVLTVVGNRQGVTNAISFVVTTAFSACLFGLGLLSKLSGDVQLAWAVGAGVPMLFLSSGVLEVLGSGFTTDKARQKHSGSRFLFGAAKAVSALLLLIGGAVYLWML